MKREALIKPKRIKMQALATNWKSGYAKETVDETQQDGDYMREKQCCTGCGEYIGHLPGYYYIEDCDECPDCRKTQRGTESWRKEITRILKREVSNGMPNAERNDILNELKKFGL